MSSNGSLSIGEWRVVPGLHVFTCPYSEACQGGSFGGDQSCDPHYNGAFCSLPKYHNQFIDFIDQKVETCNLQVQLISIIFPCLALLFYLYWIFKRVPRVLSDSKNPIHEDLEANDISSNVNHYYSESFSKKLKYFDSFTKDLSLSKETSKKTLIPLMSKPSYSYELEMLNKIKIMMFCCQVCSMFPDTFYQPLPSYISYLLKVIGLVHFSSISLFAKQCFGISLNEFNFHGKMIFSTFTPLLIQFFLSSLYMLIYELIYLLSPTKLTRQTNHAYILLLYSTSMLWIYFVSLNNVINMIFGSVQCIPLHSYNHSWDLLWKDVTIDCHDSSYHLSTAWAAIAGIIYLVIIPVVFLIISYLSLSSINQSRQTIEHNVSVVSNPRLISISLIYSSYRTEFWYWEVVMIGIRVVYVGLIPLFLPQDKLYQLYIAILFTMFVIWIHHWFKPFYLQSNQKLFDISCYQILFLLFSFLAIKVFTDEKEFDIQSSKVADLGLCILILMTPVFFYWQIFQNSFSSESFRLSMRNPWLLQTIHAHLPEITLTWLKIHSRTEKNLHLEKVWEKKTSPRKKKTPIKQKNVSKHRYSREVEEGKDDWDSSDNLKSDGSTDSVNSLTPDRRLKENHSKSRRAINRLDKYPQQDLEAGYPRYYSDTPRPYPSNRYSSSSLHQGSRSPKRSSFTGIDMLNEYHNKRMVRQQYYNTNHYPARYPISYYDQSPFMAAEHPQRTYNSFFPSFPQSMSDTSEDSSLNYSGAPPSPDSTPPQSRYSSPVPLESSQLETQKTLQFPDIYGNDSNSAFDDDCQRNGFQNILRSSSVDRTPQILLKESMDTETYNQHNSTLHIDSNSSKVQDNFSETERRESDIDEVKEGPSSILSIFRIWRKKDSEIQAKKGWTTPSPREKLLFEDSENQKITQSNKEYSFVHEIIQEVNSDEDEEDDDEDEEDENLPTQVEVYPLATIYQIKDSQSENENENEQHMQSNSLENQFNNRPSARRSPRRSSNESNHTQSDSLVTNESIKTENQMTSMPSSFSSSKGFTTPERKGKKRVKQNSFTTSTKSMVDPPFFFSQERKHKQHNTRRENVGSDMFFLPSHHLHHQANYHGQSVFGENDEEDIQMPSSVYSLYSSKNTY